MASANAIIKHYKSSLITVKRHAMVLSFSKANLVTLLKNIIRWEEQTTIVVTGGLGVNDSLFDPLIMDPDKEILIA